MRVEIKINHGNMSQSDMSFSISIPRDDMGFVGRECPEETCKKFFKILPGTGLSGVSETYCPYCGSKNPSDSFATEDQIEYAKTIAFNAIQKKLFQSFKKMEFSSKPRGAFGFGIELKVKEGKPIPIHEYYEESLETTITCSQCSLQYEIFGLFGYCPDCGQHNSFQILQNNFEMIEKILSRYVSEDHEINRSLIENALSNCISSFEGYGKEICKVHSDMVSDQDKIRKISFQNIDTANEKLIALFNIDLTKAISHEDWREMSILFQKRHLIMHRLGVIDEEYVRRSGDHEAIIGKKINVNIDEIYRLVQNLTAISQHIENSFAEFSN